ncbi:MAG: hypothetical protein L6408_01600 [Nanoarchaeota archaeon]|nr:hypothetical protein [Nanoarchaeota archaeon]
MKLFSKKKEEAKHELPPLRFPEFPKEKKVPSYESDITPQEAVSLKEAVAPPNLEIPIRKPMPRSPIAAPQRAMPIAPEEGYGDPNQELQGRGQTLFVKIERYRNALAKMEHIKDKIMEAERVLANLDEMKRQEDQEITKWHQDLSLIKNKLLSVDKGLFEGRS